MDYNRVKMDIFSPKNAGKLEIFQKKYGESAWNSNILSKNTGKMAISIQNTDKGYENVFFLLKIPQKFMFQEYKTNLKEKLRARSAVVG